MRKFIYIVSVLIISSLVIIAFAQTHYQEKIDNINQNQSILEPKSIPLLEHTMRDITQMPFIIEGNINMRDFEDIYLSFHIKRFNALTMFDVYINDNYAVKKISDKDYVFIKLEKLDIQKGDNYIKIEIKNQRGGLHYPSFEKYPLTIYDDSKITSEKLISAEFQVIYNEATKNWRTYQNNKAGYTIKYPKDFYVYEDKKLWPKENEHDQEIIFASKPRPKNAEEFLELYADKNGYAVIINSGENPKGLNLDQWLTSYFHPNVIQKLIDSKRKEAKVAGYQALIFDADIRELESLDVYFVTKNKYFSIVLMPYPTDKEIINIFQLMLDSFRVINTFNDFKIYSVPISD